MIAELFLGAQFVGCIILWVVISHTMRSQQITRTPSLLLFSLLSTLFLILVIRLSLTNLVYYAVGAGLFSIWAIVFSLMKKVKIHIFDTFMNLVFWPQAICLTLFYYSIADAESNETDTKS